MAGSAHCHYVHTLFMWEVSGYQSSSTLCIMTHNLPCTLKKVRFLSDWLLLEVMLCGVKVKSEQMILESFTVDGEWLRCPDIGREFVPPLRCQSREKSQLHWVGFVCLQRWQHQWSAYAGAWGLTSVLGKMGQVLLTTWKANIIILNQMRATTGSQRRSHGEFG